jgi:hypothetical protein
MDDFDEMGRTRKEACVVQTKLLHEYLPKGTQHKSDSRLVCPGSKPGYAASKLCALQSAAKSDLQFCVQTAPFQRLERNVNGDLLW